MTDYTWRCPVCGATYVPAEGMPEPLRVYEHNVWKARHEEGDHNDES